MGTDPIELLDDYMSGALSASEAAKLEEQLFGAVATGSGPLADAASWLDDLWRRGRTIDELGLFFIVITAAEFERIVALGNPTVLLDPDTLDRKIPDEAVVVITRLPVPDLAGVERLDVVGRVVGTDHERVYADVVLAPDATDVYVACHGETARLWPAGIETEMELVGYVDGKPRSLGRFGPAITFSGPFAPLYGSE